MSVSNAITVLFPEHSVSLHWLLVISSFSFTPLRLSIFLYHTSSLYFREKPLLPGQIINYLRHNINERQIAAFCSAVFTQERGVSETEENAKLFARRVQENGLFIALPLASKYIYIHIGI